MSDGTDIGVGLSVAVFDGVVVGVDVLVGVGVFVAVGVAVFEAIVVAVGSTEKTCVALADEVSGDSN